MAKPTGKLPQNPYQHIDFTAYIRMGRGSNGLNQTSLNPPTHTGWNSGSLNRRRNQYRETKVNVRVGPFDLAVTGDYLSLPSDNLNIQYYGFGGYSSLRVLEN